MRNKRLPETVLLDEVFRRLTAELPKAWRLEGPRLAGDSSPGPGPQGGRPDFRTDGVVDAWLDLFVGEARATLAIEVREVFQPRDALRILLAFDRVRERSTGPQPRMLVTRFLSPRTQKLLVDAGWNYADATGNVRIAIERPAMFVKLAGSERDPAPEARPLRSLKGPVAGRIVRQLADRLPPYGIRELASRALTSPAMASRVVALLEREAIVDKDGRGPILRVEWRALLARWAQEYSLLGSNRTERFLALRGRGALVEGLRRTELRYAVTGAFAAEFMRTVATSPITTIYTDDVPALARELELQPHKSPATVVLVQPVDDVAYQRKWSRDGLWLAAPSQVVADLLTGGDRDPQIAEAVMDWMAENPDAWRS